MDTQQFLAEFGHIANAPGGVARLREFVLRLAVQGRLVPQNDQDEPAEYLLMRIAGQKLPLQRQRTKKASITSVDSHKYLPSGWTLTLLNNLANPQAGFAFKANQFNQNGIGLPIIRVRDVGFSVPATYFSGEYRDEFLVKSGDWLVAMDGDFRVAMWEASTALLNQRVTRLQFYSTEINSKYVCIALQFELRKLQGIKNYTTVDHLSGSQIAESMIALPPIQEQSRIVAKVDELMALCDKLEAQQQARRKLQNTLRQSTLQAVASATSPHELQTTWARLADNFGRLLHAPDDVAEIKSLILNLAIQGLLTDRLLDDEPAEVLIARSLEAKRVRLASGEMKNKKPAATDIVDVEINVPAHWKRASLDELFQFIDYRGKTPTKTNSGVVLVTAKNVRPGFIANEPVEFLSESSYQAWMTRGFPRIGDLLITTEAPLGNVARIEEQPSFALAQRVIDLQPFTDLDTKCAMYFMMSPLFQSLLEENSTGMTAKGIKAGKLKQLLLPIPPKEEQQRIVRRVEELMRICSVLSSQLEAARKQSTRLAIAAISSLTGIAIEQEEDAMPAPKNEEEAVA